MKQEKVTFEQLVAFASGELTGREASTVQAYLAVLPEAARTAQRLLAVIRTLRADDTVAATPDAVRRALGLLVDDRVTARGPLGAIRDIGRDIGRDLGRGAGRLLARLIFDSRTQLAVAGFRGIGASYQLAYESDPARIDLQILPIDRSAGDLWRLRGQVTVRDDALLLGAVSLLEEDGEAAVATALPDDLGRFKIESPAGVYDLLIELDDGTLSVVAPRLEVGPDFV